MTTLGLIAIASALAYWGRVAASWREVAIRAIDAYERVQAAPAPTPEKETVILPASIMSMAYDYADDFARASVIARARELWDELQDWGMVSHQLSQEMGTP